MNLILLEDVKGLGNKFDAVTVKPGYGRNYLVPQQLAILATPANKAMIAERVKQIRNKEAKIVHEIEAIVARIKAQPIQIAAKTGGMDKIFGSVTNSHLADAIKTQSGVDVDRRKIILNDEVKTLGNYTANLRFSENLRYDIEFEVIPATDEA